MITQSTQGTSRECGQAQEEPLAGNFPRKLISDAQLGGGVKRWTSNDPIVRGGAQGERHVRSYPMRRLSPKHLFVGRDGQVLESRDFKRNQREDSTGFWDKRERCTTERETPRTIAASRTDRLAVR